MKTIQAIKLLLEEYKQHVERIVARSKEDYDKQVKAAQAETMGKLKKLSMLFPDIMPVNTGDSMSASEVETMIANLKRRVETKYSARLLPSGEMLHDEIYGAEFDTSTFMEWQGATSKEANFVISYNKSTAKDAISAMNYLVGNMLLSLPIKRVHLNFVDLNFTGGAQLFTKNLDKSLFRALIVDSQQLNDFCKEMQQRMVTVLQECGNLVDYNEQNLTYRYPYEVVVLLDYPNMYDYVAQQLAALFENGHKGGIYFVVLHNTDVQLPNQTKSLIDMKDHYSVLDLKSMKASIYISQLENPSISKQLFRYINEEAQRKPKARVVKADYDEMFKRPYEDTDSIIEVPIGEEPGGNKIKFLMNAVDHIHCFILGQSGSGKSVFLHNIIAGAMLKYRPEDLQFYLLDFKLGGVEFNRYRESKHVKALLVDNSDLQVTLEILRDLNEQMKERGKLLRSAGVSNIADYNRANPNNHMPQILFVADECHAMFNSSMSNNHKLFREMSEVIVRIAKEGRSQGVHLILATQTLAQTDISSEIINNISDRYLLKCASADSEKMIPNSSGKTGNLATGQVYYRFKALQEATFQSYFTSNDEVSDLTNNIVKKATNSASNGQFYFNGSQIFSIDKELINNLPAKRNNVAALGCSVDLQRAPVQISMKEDDGENVLFFGINDQEQVTRTVMNALTTLVYTARNNGRTLHTYVIDSLGFDDGKYLDVLDKLSDEGLVTIIKKRDWGTELHRMASSIVDGNIEPSLLVILGQERMRDLRLNNDIEIEETTLVKNNDSNFGQNFGSFGFGGDSAGKSKKVDISSYRKALAYILDNGPQMGVNTLLQVDQPSKILYEDYVNAKFVFGKFNHMVMLRSEEKAAAPLGLSDDIHLDQLPSEDERLRAIYYDSGSDKYQMFTPYIIK
jgi:hypothetical protein